MSHRALLPSPACAKVRPSQGKILLKEGTMDPTWKNKCLTVVVVLLAAPLLLATTATAADVTVDCAGGPADFSSVADALNALDHQGPHTITILAGNCTERVLIANRERLTITAAPIGSTFISPEPGEGDVIRIDNSRGITLIQVGATEGVNGVRIDRKSEVTLIGCSIGGNTNGVLVTGQSLFTAIGSVFVSNANNGVVLRNQSLLNAAGNLFDGNGNIGLVVRQGSTAVAGDFTPGGGNNFNGNGQRGIACVGGCTLLLNSFNGLANNGFAGLTVATGSRVGIDGSEGQNEFTGNGNGVLVFFGSQAAFAGPNSIHNNTGVGLEADENSSVFLSDLTVQNNGRGGVNALRMSTVGFAPGNPVSSNGGANVSCDSTALVYGDLTGITNIACSRIERPLGPPRPGRVRE
jgi:hypothetical protein